MILVGYQGVGKSTLAKDRLDCIDLESGCFWHDGKRPDDWYIYYCQIAEHLSAQGYMVFVSSHKVVRDYLKENSKEKLYVVYPALHLKDVWCTKLKERYESTNLEKDYKAWKNAEDRYIENIRELMASGIPHIELVAMSYDLGKILHCL